MHKVRGSSTHHQGLQGGMETSKSQGGKRKGGGGRIKVRGYRIGKRIRSITAACKLTMGLGFELVQISIDQSKPLLTVQITPKNQADTFSCLIDSGATANFISPKLVKTLKIPKIALTNPRNICMLDGSTLKTGKVWHKVQLEFQCQGLPTSAEFLVCPIGNNQAILGMPWLKNQNPSIDWWVPTVSFTETAQIASEEEADKDPLKGLPEIYHEFSKVFGEEEFKVLPPHRPYDLAIDLKEGVKLHHRPLYSMTELESQTLKKWIDKELAAGKIRRSESEAGAPVMFVKKADGSLQLVVDYRCLNEVTRKNVYPLPRQDDLMAQLQGAKLFTKLDLQWGYNNIQIREGDEYKTAFRTKYGLFETLVMPFGLTNAPAAFQHFMNDIFRDMLDTKVVIYLDDILIFSKDKASHTRDVKEVLRRLAANQLFCKLSKCSFHVDTVDYLGLVISSRGISMEEKKVQAIKEWPVPQNVKQIQSILGFTNFL
jgi:hypothetical protein